MEKKFDWGSSFSKPFFAYLEIGSTIYEKYIAKDKLGGIDLALGGYFQPLGIEFRYSSYSTVWHLIAGPINHENGITEEGAEEAFLVESQEEAAGPEMKPKGGAENAEENRERERELAGNLILYQLLFTYRERLFWKVNYAVKSGPVILEYKEATFQFPYYGYTLAIHGALEMQILENLLLSGTISTMAAVVTRPESFKGERERWRELPIRIYTTNLSLIFRI